MANEKNLRPVRTKSEARERGRNGGKASGKARREKRTQQEILKALLSSPMDEASIDKVKRLQDMKDAGITWGEAAAVIQLKKAIFDGDSKAYEIVRDTVGEKPTDRVEVSREAAEARAEVDALIARCKKRHEEDDGR